MIWSASICFGNVCNPPRSDHHSHNVARTAAGTVTELDAQARQAGCGLVFQFPERHFIGRNLISELMLTAPPATTPDAFAERLRQQQLLASSLTAVGMQVGTVARSTPLTISMTSAYRMRLTCTSLVVLAR